jgi:hypothetical protein
MSNGKVNHCPWCGSPIKDTDTVCENCDRSLEHSIIPNQVDINENVFIKFSFATEEIAESQLSTLYRLENIYITQNERVVMRFRYCDVSDEPHLSQKYGIYKTEETFGENINDIIEIYMSVKNSSIFGSAIERMAKSENGIMDIDHFNMGIHLPPVEKEEYSFSKEFLQLELQKIDKMDNFINLHFFNYATLKPKDEVMKNVKSIAQNNDIKAIQKQMSSIVSKLLEITQENPKPSLLANSPEEMVKQFVGLRDRDDGFVEETVKQNLLIKMTVEDAENLFILITKLNGKNV